MSSACLFLFPRRLPRWNTSRQPRKPARKPFLCPESSYLRSNYGFSLEKDLKKHTNVNHPDPSALFPKIKKPPAKHVCDTCSKEFTRAHNLNAHKRTHSNLRPYNCKNWGKAFVRRQGRERHVEKLHHGKGSEIGKSSQETLLPSDMEVQEGDPSLEKTPVLESIGSGGDIVSRDGSS